MNEKEENKEQKQKKTTQKKTALSLKNSWKTTNNWIKNK